MRMDLLLVPRDPLMQVGERGAKSIKIRQTGDAVLFPTQIVITMLDQPHLRHAHTHPPDHCPEPTPRVRQPAKLGQAIRRTSSRTDQTVGNSPGVRRGQRP